MDKSVHNDVLDAALDKIATATEMTLCSAAPTTLLEATTTFALADVALTGGDYTNADGDINGRKVTIAAKTNIIADATGTATHVALNDATDLLYVTTSDSLSVVLGNAFDFPAWDIEIADPV